MPESLKLFFSFLVGFMFLGGSLYKLYHQLRAQKGTRSKAQIGIFSFFLLIGLADLLKAVKDLQVWLGP